MKISKKVLMIVMISAIIAGSLGLLRASAEGVSMTDQQIEQLKAESIRTGLSVAELIRRAIDFYLARRGKGQDEKT